MTQADAKAKWSMGLIANRFVSGQKVGICVWLTQKIKPSKAGEELLNLEFAFNVKFDMTKMSRKHRGNPENSK